MSSESTPPKISPHTSGSRWYIASYVGNSLRKHRTRFFSLLIGIIIGVSLVASIFVWTDTGAQVATIDYFEANLYQLGIQQLDEPSVDSQLIFNVQNWFTEQSTYQGSDVIYHSVGLLNATNWNSSTPYLPHPYTKGLKDFQTFFVNNTFLHRVAHQFQFTGVFELVRQLFFFHCNIHSVIPCLTYLESVYK